MPQEESAGPGAGDVTFQVLGALAVRDADGRSLDLKGPRHRAVLARLLIARRRTVPVDWMVDDFWEDPPPRAVGAIRTFVGDLRKVLEPGRARRAPARLLVTSGPGYALLAAGGAVDAWRFEGAVGEAGRLLSGGGAASGGGARVALGVLDDALSGWRGPAYAEWATAEWARGEAARLEGLRLLAVERRASAALALGRAAEAVLDLEVHVEGHPWREEAWELLAVALYRAGRQGDALGVLRRARERLVGELGVEPGAGLRRLEVEILAQRGGGVLGAGTVVTPCAPSASAAAPAPLSMPPARFDGAPAGRGSQLVGREAELADLEASARGVVREGRLALALISGDAGAGKTALVRELAGRLKGEGWATAWGRASEQGGVPAGWPWVEVLGELGVSEADAGGQGAGGDRFWWYRRVGELISGVADRGHPLLLVLDDLHWADSGTLELLASLVERPMARAVLLVGTYRDGEVSDGVRELLGRVARAEPTRVRVGALAETAVGDLARAVSPRPLDAATVRTVHRRSGGNPFFVREIVRLYATEGAAALSQVPEGVRDIVRRRLGTLPTGAREVLLRAALVGPTVDLDVLSELIGDEDAVLEGVEAGVAAGFLVGGAGGFLGGGAAGSLGEGELGGQREGELGGRGEEAGERVEFAHALVRETLYRDLSAPRRARLHTAVAELLERLRPDSVEAIAHHYLSAGTGAVAARAADFAARAARRAEAAFAPHEAVRLWRAALDAYDRGGAGGDLAGGRERSAGRTGGPERSAGRAGGRERLGIVMGLVRNLAVTGALADARRYRSDALAAAEATGDPELTARVIGAFDVPGIWARNDDEALSRRIVAAALRTLDALPDDGTTGRRATRSRLLSTVGMETRGARTERGAEAAREAERLARAVGEVGTGGVAGVAPGGAADSAALLAFALNARYLHTFHRPGLAPERARIGEELTALAAHHGLVAFEVLGHLMLLQAHSALADLDRADGHAAAVDRLAERHGLPLARVFTEWYAALRAAVAGRVPEAEAGCRAAAARMRGGGMSGMEREGEGGTGDGEGLLELALLCLRVQSGGADADADVVADADRGVDPDAGVVADGGAEVDADAAADVAAAAAAAAGTGTTHPRPLPHDQLLEARLCLRARAALRSGAAEPGALEGLYRELLPACGELAGAGSGVLTLEPVALYVGDLAAALGWPDAAARHHRQARVVAERAGAPHWVAAADARMRR
ncbi:BTAD domain-containing putative transcriptional regulator [Streptomyces sp. NPDC127108]|uniref:BTAD domain-containing putative transcriptional regulator n=1 Tax=Streptomyces sp. NPDC127108 TaxID=3345361 RepID=UPI0036364417